MVIDTVKGICCQITDVIFLQHLLKESFFLADFTLDVWIKVSCNLQVVDLFIISANTVLFAFCLIMFFPRGGNKCRMNC